MNDGFKCIGNAYYNFILTKISKGNATSFLPERFAYTRTVRFKFFVAHPFKWGNQNFLQIIRIFKVLLPVLFKNIKLLIIYSF